MPIHREVVAASEYDAYVRHPPVAASNLVQQKMIIPHRLHDDSIQMFECDRIDW